VGRACSHSFDADINSATKFLDPSTVRTLPKESVLNYNLVVVIVTDWSTTECTRYAYMSAMPHILCVPKSAVC
jgi:hypothetical protein